MSEKPDPYQIWQSQAEESSSDPVAPASHQMPNNQIAYRSYRIIAWVLFTSLIVLSGSIFGYRHILQRRAAAEQAAKAEAAATAHAKEAEEAARRQEESAAKEKAETAMRETQRQEELLQQKKRLVREWVTNGAQLKERKATLALVVSDGPGKSNRALATRIASIFGSGNVICDPGIFADRYIEEEVSRTPDVTRLLANPLFDPADFCSGLIICRLAQSFSKLTEPANMVAVDTTWEFRLLLFGAARADGAWSVSVRGVGFREANALQNAIDRAEPELRAVSAKIDSKIGQETFR